ncbi:kinase-like protein [Saccharata proteae CBS 121410]|uniref:non-specific serine/threonine protein kinase n=1 Tax=Saccharata proteae CBS 121410 TaxID=1314787 RepID=A0A9P4HUM5_9PEZI|nr:kinase-like protein [Saccharata proteae CBS 121410]
MSGFIDARDARQQQARLYDYNKRFKTVKQLHLDANSSVDLKQRQSTGKVFVVKRVAQRGRLSQEVTIMQSLPQYQHIIRLLKIYEKLPGRHTTTMHMEYCSMGDLHDWAVDGHAGTPTPNEAILWHVYFHLAEAVAFLHTGYGTNRFNPWTKKAAGWAAVMHSDIKPANIFLAPGRYVGLPNIKLGDFGASTILRYPAENTSYVAGTPNWLAPESIEQSPPMQGLKGDVWAMGAVIHWLVHRAPPIEDVVMYVRNKYGESEAQGSRSQLLNTYMWEIPRRVKVIDGVMSEAGEPYSQALSGFMMRAMHRDPESRITAIDLVSKMSEPRSEKVTEWIEETEPRDARELLDVVLDDIVSDVE